MCLGLDVFDPLCFAYFFAKLYDFFVFELFVFLGLSSGSCIYMKCASSCESPCRSPLVGWGIDGGNGGVVTGRGDVWFEGRAIVRWCVFGRRINGVIGL